MSNLPIYIITTLNRETIPKDQRSHKMCDLLTPPPSTVLANAKTLEFEERFPDVVYASDVGDALDDVNVNFLRPPNQNIQTQTVRVKGLTVPYLRTSRAGSFAARKPSYTTLSARGKGFQLIAFTTKAEMLAYLRVPDRCAGDETPAQPAVGASGLIKLRDSLNCL